MEIKDFIVRAGKLVTLSDSYGTIYDGALIIYDGKIHEIGDYSLMKRKYDNLKTVDYSNYVITPSLVDCHTHVLEYAPTSIYPVTKTTHLMGGISLILNTLSSGVTSLGEQICGHPDLDFTKNDYLEITKNLPIDISFSVSSISIGLSNVAHFSGVTGSTPLNAQMLLDNDILDKMIAQSDYPGENIFINATPANLVDSLVPRAGEIIYTQEQLNIIVNKFHEKGKKIGCHVAGEEAIDMAINACFNVIHHGHGITEAQIQRVLENNISVVATPLGGTHLRPNSPEEIVELFKKGIIVAISTDGYLPPPSNAPWFYFADKILRGPESLMLLAHPAMKILSESGCSENEILKLITLYPAMILEKEKYNGSLEIGKNANFLVTTGIPGLEITETKDILQVFYKGERVIYK